MFPAWHIAVTAIVTAVVTAAVIAATTAGWRGRSSLVLGDLVGVGVAAGLGVLVWRLGANVPTLNADPIPGVSPADVLSGPLASVAADVYVRLRGVGASERLAVAPAVAALVALIVNIVTI
jgi:hypothetical protein